MAQGRVLEQHIAVFGESGSGKTVLVSSFFGAAQQPNYRSSSLFRVIAEKTSDGNRLLKNYLEMRNSGVAPAATRFDTTAYQFALKLKDGASTNAVKASGYDAARLVWHDYPGEWFEQDPSGPKEARRRVDTFRALLKSDVAIVLVDGQRILENAGSEERYLKSLLTNISNGLIALKEGVLDDGKKFVQFPRVWILALSKSDLLPDYDVFGFRDLLVAKASSEIDELRDVVAEFVEAPEALSVGEDFLCLSSARFEPGRIDVGERVGVELMLPLAATFAVERKLRWAKKLHYRGRVAEVFMGGVPKLLAAGLRLLGTKVPGPWGPIIAAIDPNALERLGALAGEKLQDVNGEALAKRDYLTAILTGFQLELEQGEQERVLLKSLR